MLKSLLGMQDVPVSTADGEDGAIPRFLVDVDRWIVSPITANGVPVIPPTEGTHASVVDSEEVIGLHLEALGGPIGHLDDLLIDDETWRVRYVVVDPKNWWLGKHVLISPEWIERFDWSGRKVHVNVEREAIKSAPEYDAGLLVTREDEAAMFRHYQRRPYWSMS